MLKLADKPLRLFLGDLSAVVTAWLLALSLPAIAPWWLTVLGTLVAIVVVKHLYGGLGQNPFNPAMAGFAVLIVAYPQLMSQWPPAAPGGHEFWTQWQAIFGARQLDALTMATPLDALRTSLHTAGGAADLPSLLAGNATFGQFGGRGWEWIGLAYLAGGAFLLQQRIISWHMPCAFLATLMGLAGLANLLDGARHAGPLFHLLTGGTLLAAFFIVTDPVSGATTPRGKLIFAAGAGAIVWIIRSFGAYPDGIAFAVLLMNMAAPLIDMHTQPPVFGHKRKPGPTPR